MGIEYIARAPIISSNHGVTRAHERRVRLLCEKWRHTSQRQPMPALFVGCVEDLGSPEDWGHARPHVGDDRRLVTALDAIQLTLAHRTQS
jgi:hypothetical protein